MGLSTHPPHPRQKNEKRTYNSIKCLALHSQAPALILACILSPDAQTVRAGMLCVHSCITPTVIKHSAWYIVSAQLTFVKWRRRNTN